MNNIDKSDELALALNSSNSLSQFDYKLSDADRWAVISKALSSLTNVRGYAQYSGVSTDTLKASVRHLNKVIKEVEVTKKLHQEQLKQRASVAKAAVTLLVAGGISVPPELANLTNLYPSLSVLKPEKDEKGPVETPPTFEGELVGNEKFEYTFPVGKKMITVLAGDRQPLHLSIDVDIQSLHSYLSRTSLKRHKGKLVSLKAKKLLLAKGI